MCLGDWKTHGSEYYECSRYKENPDIVNQSQQAQAREALKKYLFYFERWENHNKSLQLEAQTYQRIHEKIQERVINNLGTWIDWQYLQNAAKLLAECRYTLQYTYPYAYYMESGPRKKLVREAVLLLCSLSFRGAFSARILQASRDQTPGSWEDKIKTKLATGKFCSSGPD